MCSFCNLSFPSNVFSHHVSNCIPSTVMADTLYDAICRLSSDELDIVHGEKKKESFFFLVSFFLWFTQCVQVVLWQKKSLWKPNLIHSHQSNQEWSLHLVRGESWYRMKYRRFAARSVGEDWISHEKKKYGGCDVLVIFIYGWCAYNTVSYYIMLPFFLLLLLRTVYCGNDLWRDAKCSYLIWKCTVRER